MVAPLPEQAVAEAVRIALAEDLGDDGDITTRAVVPSELRGAAVLIAKEPCVLAGLPVFEACFRAVDASVAVDASASDGDAIERGATVARVTGPLGAILTAERTALNFVQRLSGVATLARRFAEAAPGVQVRDTRKTTPGLRALEKYAVRVGGATNHRMGLYDAFLIKDNHIAAAGGVEPAVKAARAARPGLSVEVECETLDQVREALDAGADEILLDNMDLETLREAAALARGRARTEASGGITLDTVAAVAATGVDAISAGAITHSARAVDLSLEVA